MTLRRPPLRVALAGTGNVGSKALKHLILDDRFDLVGVWVSSPDKVGRDAAELAGVETPTGIAAVDDLDALIALRPDCVVYCAMGDVRLFEAIADVQRFLGAGINVAGTAPNSLAYPWGVLPDSMIEPLEQAARANGVSLFINGVDPGWANDVMPLAVASTCRTVEQVRCSEFADYATYDSATVMSDVMGFGRDPDDVPMLLKPGILSSAWGTAVRQLAAGLGWEVERIEETYERDPAAEDFEVASGTIAKGTQAGLRFEVIGYVDGQPKIVIEHVTRLFEGQRPDWASPAQPGGAYRVEIVGEPSYTVDIMQTSAEGDHNYSAILVGAGRVVNAIPALVAAPPGIRTALDLPFHHIPPHLSQNGH